MFFEVIVNSTDTFKDCWIPFFTLFNKYWPDYFGRIYLNTELKDFNFPGLNIRCIKNGEYYRRSKITWSECLYHALEEIPTNIILYLQEDYFVNEPVKHEIINNLVQLMKTEPIDCIQLTNHATPGPFQKCEYEDLLRIDKIAPYLISTQAALWKKDVLKQYLRKHESAWQFEDYGTRRARIYNNNFFILDPGKYSQESNPVLPYCPTGIIRGKWNKVAVSNLFKENNIDVDFSTRGWFLPIKSKLIDRIKKKLKQKSNLISFQDLVKLYFKNRLHPKVSNIK